MVWALANALTTAPVANTVTAGASVPTDFKASPAPSGSTTVIAGFRMERTPEVDIVFGDTQAYRDRIDSFFALSEDLRRARKSFTRHQQSILQALATQKRGCPTAMVAPHYSRAREVAERYRRVGIEFETHYAAIQTLHRYGETAGLTPDYRWKINRVKSAYGSALADFRDIKVVITKQLDPELSYRGCRPETLAARGKTMEPQPVGVVAANTPASPVTRRYRKRATDPAPVAASTVTFFIDNRDCAVSQTIIADGNTLGTAPAGSKAAFQSLSGSHVLCILPEGSTAQCGEVGTVRTAYVHDGWSMTMHCQD